MLYSRCYRLLGFCLLGLVEFEKCAIFAAASRIKNNLLGLVEFEKCAILLSAVQRRRL